MQISVLFKKICTRLRQHFLALLWLAVACAMIGYGLSGSINFYVTVDEVVRQPDKFEQQFFRLGGYVQEGSIKTSEDKIVFQAIMHAKSESKSQVTVIFKGVPPSLFKEKKAMVADGMMQDGVFYAHELLAKHDENYQVPGIKPMGGS